MNCANWEERLALYAGGDLPRGEAEEVERHLRECAGCQVFASGLKQSMTMLEEMHRELPLPAHYAAVRARVLSQIEAMRRPFWQRAWVWALAAACVLLAIMWNARSPAPAHRSPAPIVAQQQPPAPAAPPSVDQIFPEKPRQVSIRPRRTRRPKPLVVAEAKSPRTAESASPLTIKLSTDDPDVVIYWISDPTGELK